VLSADEVVRFLEAIPSLKSRTALTTVYAAGLAGCNTPMRRIRSACCARAASGHTAAAPPMSVMNSRRFN
jgi:hypothetical protein